MWRGILINLLIKIVPYEYRSLLYPPPNFLTSLIVLRLSVLTMFYLVSLRSTPRRSHGRSQFVDNLTGDKITVSRRNR